MAKCIIFPWFVPIGQIGFWEGRRGTEGGRSRGLSILMTFQCRGLKHLGSISWIMGRFLKCSIQQMPLHIFKQEFAVRSLPTPESQFQVQQLALNHWITRQAYGLTWSLESDNKRHLSNLRDKSAANFISLCYVWTTRPVKRWSPLWQYMRYDLLQAWTTLWDKDSHFERIGK